MKQLLIILSLLSIGNRLSAQSMQSYVQFSAGYSPADIYVVSGEYGKTYKCLDAGISIDHENGLRPKQWNYDTGVYTQHAPNVTYVPPMSAVRDAHPDANSFAGSVATAIRFNAKIDLVRLFIPDSRHAFKIGGGLGIEWNEGVIGRKETEDVTIWDYQAEYYWKPTGKATYEYAVTSKLTLGVFFYGGLDKTYGISIRRNFQ